MPFDNQKLDQVDRMVLDTILKVGDRGNKKIWDAKRQRHIHLSVGDHTKWHIAKNGFVLSVAPCAQGGYHAYGNGSVKNGLVTLKLYTIRSIIYNKFTSTHIFLFPTADPDFPKTLIMKIRQAAIDGLRAFDLAHKRNWRNYSKPKMLVK